MNEALDRALREALAAWEKEAAAQWDALVRSPDFLHRVGRSLSRSLEAQQHMMESAQAAFLHAAAQQEQSARIQYLLERLSKQVDMLADRIDRLETALHND